MSKLKHLLKQTLRFNPRRNTGKSKIAEESTNKQTSKQIVESEIQDDRFLNTTTRVRTEVGKMVEE